MRIFGLFGAGGFASEVMPIAYQAFSACPDPAIYKLHLNMRTVDRHQESEFFTLEGEKFFNIAIANSKIRATIAGRCMRGCEPINIIALTAEKYHDVVLGPGAIICNGTVITARTTIGRFFHADFGCYISHDCVIGDFVTFAPHARCGGNVRIGDHATIGMGASIRQGLTIGEGAVVGMGAVVVKDVPAGVRVGGNPAVPLAPRA